MAITVEMIVTVAIIVSVVFVVHDATRNMIGVLQSDDIIGLRVIEFESVLLYVNNRPRLPIQHFRVSTTD